MSNMVIPDVGKERLIEWMLSTEDASFGDLDVALYTNNYTPVDGSIFSSFTAASFTGSSPIAIHRSDWTGPTLTSHVAYMTLPTPPAWTCTAGGPQTCYGWFLYDPSDDTVIAAQKFAVARVMDTGSIESLNPFQIGLQTLH